MTEAQRKRFYFPVWAPTAARLDWRMAGGRLIADLDEQFAAATSWPDPAGEMARCIITRARMTAATEQRATTAEDLRHACNLTASGGQCSSSGKFTQKQLNHFDRLCAVLQAPWNLAAVKAWLNPKEDDRLRTVEYLRKLANEGRLISISRNAWGTADWEGLSQDRLDSLTVEIKKHGWPKYPRAAKEGQPF